MNPPGRTSGAGKHGEHLAGGSSLRRDLEAGRASLVNQEWKWRPPPPKYQKQRFLEKRFKELTDPAAHPRPASQFPPCWFSPGGAGLSTRAPHFSCAAVEGSRLGSGPGLPEEQPWEGQGGSLHAAAQRPCGSVMSAGAWAMERDPLLTCLSWSKHLRSALERPGGAQPRDCPLLRAPAASPFLGSSRVAGLKHPPMTSPACCSPLSAGIGPGGFSRSGLARSGLGSVQPRGSCH